MMWKMLHYQVNACIHTLTLFPGTSPAFVALGMRQNLVKPGNLQGYANMHVKQ